MISTLIVNCLLALAALAALAGVLGLALREAEAPVRLRTAERGPESLRDAA